MKAKEPFLADRSGTLRVAAAQMKFADTISANLARIEQTVRRAAQKAVDVILFPECATTGYGYDFTKLRPETIRDAHCAIGALAAEFKIHIAVGTPAFQGKLLQNCLVVFNRTGQMSHRYAKCHLTEFDRQFFVPGNALSLFQIDTVKATAIICHERRYPEMVRLAVMAGAQVLFHPNAGMDSLGVSRRKRGGRDGIAVRAFENGIFYVFANSVGPQAFDKWSAGDSKIVAPDARVLKLANNRDEDLLVESLELKEATRKYAIETLEFPRFLAPFWRQMIRAVHRRAKVDLPG
jgi:predicted amidohydrolase